MVHADLEHAIIGAHGQPRQRQRHAPMIVETLVRRMNHASAAEHGAEDFLGRRFASAARHCDPLAEISHARSGGKIAQPLQRIANHQQRRTFWRVFRRARNERRRCASLEGVFQKFMAVANIAQRHKNIAGL